MPNYISVQARDLLLKLLHKNPRNRIKMEGVKSHPFFAEIDWKNLALKQVEPPVILRNDDSGSEENDEMKLLSQGLESNKKLFTDKDYTEENKFRNRVK